MRAGLTISAVVHAALLLWGLVSFTARPLEAAPKDALPIDIISAKDFTEITKGVKDAKKVENQKPAVDKLGEKKLAEEAKPKVSEKPEIKTAAAAEPPPAAASPPEAKPDKKPPPQTDPIAEALKRDEAKRKQAEAKAKADQKRLEQQQAKFDPTQIAALLDKRNPQRTASTGDMVSQPSLGYVGAQGVQLSQSELDALRRRLSECWNPPVGALDAPNLKVVLRVLFRRDGSVAAPPVLVAGTASSLGPAMAESAQRAIMTCQPFKMLRAETYDQWKDIEITFDPREMFRS